jgi:hypothetical protein
MNAESSQSAHPVNGEELYTIQDLVRLGFEVLQTMESVRNVRMIPGCCTQDCCNGAVLDILRQSPEIRS